ncbi:hypothetical protein EQ828_19910 [Ectopseudomonas mendocina]|nr:hypothetical protein [Pseudomonas mendocina]TRO15815.1 hypothetical protein EQ828_19910 [Pseudomonas mendocina]
MIRRIIPSELLFRFSADGDSYKVTGAHYKTLSFIELDGEALGHKESDALDISQADPAAIEAALGGLNTALVFELGQHRAQAQARDAELEQQAGALAEAQQALDAERQRLVAASHEIASLTAQVAALQRQLEEGSEAVSAPSAQHEAPLPI